MVGDLTVCLVKAAGNIGVFFLCERHLGHVPWSLRLRFSLCTTSDSRPGPGVVEPRLAVSLRPEGHRQYHYTADASGGSIGVWPSE